MGILGSQNGGTVRYKAICCGVITVMEYGISWDNIWDNVWYYMVLYFANQLMQQNAITRIYGGYMYIFTWGTKMILMEYSWDLVEFHGY